jgi:predicted transposase YdaD
MAMSDMSFESVLEEYGFTAKWENRGREIGLEEGREAGREEGREAGREEGREETVNRLYQYGMTPGQIAEALMLPPDTVAGYLKDA